MTQQEQIEAILNRRERRRKDNRDGKRAAAVIILLIIATMIFGGCRSQRGPYGCSATQKMSGYR